MKNSIGIDISKAHLDAVCLATNRAARFTNDKTGFAALRRWIGDAQPDLVVYEATGMYHAGLEQALGSHLPLAKVNPLQARRFAQARGTRAKTDQVDAALLADMGRAFSLAPDIPTPKEQRDLKELQISRSALIKDRTRLKNRLQTQTLALTRRQTKARLAQIDRHLKDIDAEIEARLKKTRPRSLDILTSIPGIGAVSAAALLIECPELGNIGRKQIASLAGLAPMTRQSGTWRGKAFIQGGRKFLRDALYMPALVAMRYNTDLKTKYTAMIKAGKPPKVAITTLMRKLIELANTLIKENRKWQPKLA